jgi:hypothetical protein
MQSKIHISFASKCLPYAELATYLLTKSTSKLSLSQNGLVNSLVLLPTGPPGSGRPQTITGKYSITRYFARPNHHLYEAGPSALLVVSYLNFNTLGRLL